MTLSTSRNVSRDYFRKFLDPDIYTYCPNNNGYRVFRKIFKVGNAVSNGVNGQSRRELGADDEVDVLERDFEDIDIYLD